MTVRLELRDNFLEGDLEADRGSALKQFQLLKKQLSNYLETKNIHIEDNLASQTANDLDHNFMVNYEEWLYREVFGDRPKWSSVDSSSSNLEMEMSDSLSNTDFVEFDEDFNQDQKETVPEETDDFTEAWTDGFTPPLI